MSNENQLPSIEPYSVEEIPENNFVDSGSNTFNDLEESSARKFPILLIVMAIAVIGLVVFGFLLLNSFSRQNNASENNQQQINTSVLIQWRGAFLDKNIIQPLIDEYEKLKPNVKIDYSNEWPISSNFEEAARSYQLKLNSDLGDIIDAPDIFTVHNSWAGDYELIAAPSTVYNSQAFSELFYPAAVNDFANNGTVYGSPLWMDTFAIVYNKNLLESVGKSEPDTNWNDFKNTADSLTNISRQKIETAGFASGIVNNVDFSYELVLTLIRQNGSKLNNENNEPIFSTNPNTLAALEYFKTFAGTKKTWDKSFSNDSIAFLEEKVAMIFIPSWRLRSLLQINEDQSLGIQIGVAEIPKVQDQETINWADYWGLMVNGKRNNAQASWEFIQWLNQPEQQTQLHQNIKDTLGNFGHLYPIKSMKDNKELIDDNYLSVYNRALPFAESWYIIKGRQIKELFKKELSSTNIDSNSLKRLEDEIKKLTKLKGDLETLESN